MTSSMLALWVLAAALLSNTAAAQPYPARPIRLIVPATPGGGSDVPSRIVAQALTDDLGWRFVVDNRGGASGRIGAEIAAKSPPDGYTLLVANTTPNAVVQGAVPNLPYDTLRDFAPVSLFATSDFNLVVHPSVPATTVKELIALARAKPGELRFGSVGNISGAHVTGELFKQLAGINIVHVPYKGAAPAMVALLSGEIQIYFGSGPSVSPHAKTGKLRMIATTGTKRSRFFPDLPTVGETVPGHEGRLWYGMAAPAGTPKEIIATLNKAIVTAGSSTKVVDQLAAVGMDSVNDSPAEFAAFIKAEIAKWGKVVKTSGTPVE
ncbi:MAG TPA: tripartite tricarboxylate transporter substrate binding protein [Burkholderiales bacterium]|nr:tripartite tricarboxylate transporter substrate binding protein [Burkholderiales bacterium]